MADQSNLTITQQLAGLTVGSPRNITAQHMRDIVLSIDTKIDSGVGSGDLKSDGSVALAANWNMGAFKMTARQFESNVASGTPPLIVASIDRVPNLNADRVDGVEGAEIILRNGSVPLTGSWTFGDFNLLPTITNTANLASGTVAMATVFVRTLQPDVGQSLLIREASGAARINFVSGGAVRILDNVSFSFGNVDNAVIQWDTFQTNPHLILGVDSVTNIFLITDQDRIGTDFGIGTITRPTFIIHDGSVTLTNKSNLSQVAAQFTINCLASSGTIAQQIAGINILTTATNVTISQIVGAEPINNTTGLDSRKLGFESRLWDGAAPQTRTGWLRTADFSGQDDQIKWVFSSDDNGGVEADFLELRFDTNAYIKPVTGSLIIERADGADIITFGAALTTLAGSFRWNDGASIKMGSGDDFQWIYQTISQTNNTLLWGTQGTEGNTVVFTDKARMTLDHVVGTPTTPTWRWHDGSAVAGNWGSITHDGTNLSIVVNAGDLEITGNIIPEADGTRSIGSATATIATGWIRVIRPGAGTAFTLLDPAGGLVLRAAAGETSLNDNGIDKDFRVEGNNDTVAFTVDAGLDRVGVGVALAGHLAKFHVDQFTTDAAIPVLYLDQADLSEEFIEFASTIGVGNPIEAIAAKSLTITHFIRVTVTGVGLLYFGVGTIA